MCLAATSLLPQNFQKKKKKAFYSPVNAKLDAGQQRMGAEVQFQVRGDVKPGPCLSSAMGTGRWCRCCQQCLGAT
jgi:hypothetical protein